MYQIQHANFNVEVVNPIIAYSSYSLHQYHVVLIAWASMPADINKNRNNPGIIHTPVTKELHVIPNKI